MRATIRAAALAALTAIGADVAAGDPPALDLPAPACAAGTVAMSAVEPAWREQWCERPDGTRHGPAASWYTSGRPRQVGAYVDGKPDGSWTYWYENGARRAAGRWRDGHAHGRWIYWSEKGTPQSAGRFRDGVRWGRWRYWDDDGRLRAEGVWRDGRRRGLWTEISPDDGRLRQVRYRRGEEVGASVRVTMAQLHAGGGVPPRWTFSPPPGDPVAGRALFERLGCPGCHTIAGETFAAEASGTAMAAALGPDLTGMGRHHPPGYFAESIVNPDAVIVEGPGHVGPDGRSRMPTYPDMTLAELADLVAYLMSLTGPECEH